jgi:NADPH-dependent 2,4-dienoyl-CoA reductase/sulfur reductase-like enzyme
MTRAPVLVVGAGPAGLSAAALLAPHCPVIVLEREGEAGGIPRHSEHTGYGIRDLRRVLSGPAYAQRLVAAAESAGAQIRTSSMVTGWAADGSLEVSSPAGRETLAGSAVLLATGARERPRTARLIPGDRPAGVYTTGALQNLVHLHGRPVGRRAVVVGAQPVSWSAVLTLRAAGCATVAVLTEHARAEAYPGMRLAGRLALRAPLLTGTRIVAVHGRGRVESVEVADVHTGTRRHIGCDTLVFTGDWIPDSELARAGGLTMDAASHGPLVDTALRTSDSYVFAAGNLTHPVDTADVAALSGAHAARNILAALDAPRRELPHGVRLSVTAPLRWVSPGVLRPGDPMPARGRLVLWCDAHVAAPHVEVRQDGRLLTSRRVPWPASPGRAFRLPATALEGVDRTGGEVTIGLRPARRSGR